MRIVHKCLFCAKNCTDFVNNSGTYVECILSHMESTSTEDPKSLQRQKFLCKRTHVLSLSCLTWDRKPCPEWPCPVLLGTGCFVMSYLGQDALSCPTWDRLPCPVLLGTECLVRNGLGAELGWTGCLVHKAFCEGYLIGCPCKCEHIMAVLKQQCHQISILQISLNKTFQSVKQAPIKSGGLIMKNHRKKI